MSRPEHDPRRPTDPAMSMIMSKQDFLAALNRDARPDPDPDPDPSPQWPEVDVDEQAARFASVPQDDRATWEPPPLEFLEKVLKGLRNL